MHCCFCVIEKKAVGFARHYPQARLRWLPISAPYARISRECDTSKRANYFQRQLLPNAISLLKQPGPYADMPASQETFSYVLAHHELANCWGIIMQLGLKPYVTNGIVIVGAAALVAAPITISPPDIGSPIPVAERAMAVEPKALVNDLLDAFAAVSDATGETISNALFLCRR
jgi:hypothetical protein